MKHLPSLLLLAFLTIFSSSCATSGGNRTTQSAIGQYAATVAQIRLATERAEHFYNQLSPAEKTALADAHVRYLAVQTLKPTYSQTVEIKKSIAANSDLAALYGFSSAAPGSAPAELKKPVQCLMLWDSQSKSVVGTECYAFMEVPTAGTMAKFNTYSAQVVASPNY